MSAVPLGEQPAPVVAWCGMQPGALQAREITLSGFASREMHRAYEAWLESGEAHRAFGDWYDSQPRAGE